MAKIDDVKAKKRGLPHRDDGCMARIAGEQRELAKEIPWPETDRLGSQSDFDLARGDKIHAVAAFAAPNDDGPSRIIARAQKLRHIHDGGGADIVEERNLGDEIPGSQKLAPPGFLSKAHCENARPQGEDENAADQPQHVLGKEERADDLKPGVERGL